MKSKEYTRLWRKKNPWLIAYNGARSRCVYEQGKYFGRVKHLITPEDFKTLWFRDKAWLLKEPCIVCQIVDL